MKILKRIRRVWWAFRWDHDRYTLQVSVDEEGRTRVWVDGRERLSDEQGAGDAF